MPNELLRSRVEAVEGNPLPHGLLALPTVTAIEDVHEELGLDWQPVSCGVASTTGWCPPDMDDPDREKVFNPVTNASTPPVTAYAGVDCSAVGWTFAEGIEKSLGILATGEQAAIEAWVWENLIVLGAGNVSAAPGDASVVGRLGVLEDALAAVYGGVGVVHVPVVLSAYMMASGLLVQQGSRLRTITGHDVVIGAGYPSTTGGNTVMGISGPVTVRQGKIETIPKTTHQALVTDNNGAFTNDRRVLAERTSVVLVECGTFITSVERTCCGSVGS